MPNIRRLGSQNTSEWLLLVSGSGNRFEMAVFLPGAVHNIEICANKLRAVAVGVTQELIMGGAQQALQDSSGTVY
jgi:hypothetical protein